MNYKGNSLDLVDVGENCKWDTKTGAIRTNNGEWIIPRDNVFDTLKEDESEEKTNNVHINDQTKEENMVYNIYYLDKEQILWDKTTGAVRRSDGPWMNPINKELKEIPMRLNEVLTIFKDDRHRVIWDREIGSIKVNDGPWMNPINKEPDTLKQDSSEEPIVSKETEKINELCEDDTDNAHISTVERYLGEKVVSIRDAPSKLTDLFMPYFSIYVIKDYFQITKGVDSDEVYRVRLFSPKTEYIIYINYDRNYIGCIRNNRKKRAGETWNRGSDFPDGKIFPNTVYNIVNKIFCDMFEPISETVRKY